MHIISDNDVITSTFAIVVIFCRGSVPKVVVPSYAFGWIYIPWQLGWVPSIDVQSYDARK